MRVRESPHSTRIRLSAPCNLTHLVTNPEGNEDQGPETHSEAAEVFARLAADPNARRVERDAEVTFIGNPVDDTTDD